MGHQKLLKLAKKIDFESLKSLRNSSLSKTPKKIDQIFSSGIKNSNSLQQVSNFDDFKVVMRDFKQHFQQNYPQFQDEFGQNFKQLKQSLSEYLELD